MSDHPSVLQLLPALHREASRILPQRYHGRIRPSDLAQTTAQILLRSKVSRIACVVSWSRGIIRKLISKEFSRPKVVERSAESASCVHVSGTRAVPFSTVTPGCDFFADILQAAGLDPSSRVILHEYFVEGQTMRSIASRLGMPLSTLHSRFREALDKVRESCGGEFRID